MKAWQLELLLRGIDQKVETALKANDELAERVYEIEKRLASYEQGDGLSQARALGAYDDEDLDFDVEKLLDQVELPEEEVEAIRGSLGSAKQVPGGAEAGRQETDPRENSVDESKEADEKREDEAASTESESGSEDDETAAATVPEAESEEPPTLEEFAPHQDSIARAMAVLGNTAGDDAALEADEDQSEAEQEPKADGQDSNAADDEKKEELSAAVLEQLEQMRDMIDKLQMDNDQLRTEAAEASNARKQAEEQAAEAAKRASEAADRERAEAKRREEERARREREIEEEAQRRREQAELEEQRKAEAEERRRKEQAKRERMAAKSAPSQEEEHSPAYGQQPTGEEEQHKKFAFFRSRQKPVQGQDDAPAAAAANASGAAPARSVPHFTQPAAGGSKKPDPDAVERMTKVVAFMVAKMKRQVPDAGVATAGAIRAAAKSPSMAQALCEHYGIGATDYQMRLERFQQQTGLQSEREIPVWIKKVCWPGK